MKKVKTKPKRSLFVKFETYSHEGMDHDEGEAGRPYSGFHHTVTELTVMSLEKLPPEAFAEELTVSEKVFKSKRAFLVVVRYSTGGTFGRNEGEYKFIAAFANQKDATSLAKEIQTAYKDYKDGKGKYTLVPETKNPNYKEIYCSWHGYFEGLENIEIHDLNIND